MKKHIYKTIAAGFAGSVFLLNRNYQNHMNEKVDIRVEDVNGEGLEDQIRYNKRNERKIFLKTPQGGYLSLDEYREHCKNRFTEQVYKQMGYTKETVSELKTILEILYGTREFSK